MACKSSAVAVCCSSASRRLGQRPRVFDRDHRLVGKVLTSSICRPLNGWTLEAHQHDDAGRIALAQ